MGHNKNPPQFACPFPFADYPAITLAHGGGGRLTAQLIDQIFRPAFFNPELEAQHDGAVLKIAAGNLAFSTDSYVISPLVFPGGDIGSLSVIGTCNDLAMCGARALALSCALILEEGLETAVLAEIARSMRSAADEVGARVVTGDIKVVDRGKGDGVFINTSGVGMVRGAGGIGPSAVRTGDSIILSGDIGRHGIAVLAKRQGLEFETELQSDLAHLTPAVTALVEAGVELHCLRDLTRGGLATALVEIASASELYVTVEEERVMVSEAVQGACEILGLDPLYVANEGRFICILPGAQAQKALEILRSCPACQDSRIIGAVKERRPGGAGRAALKTGFGVERLLERLSGEQLPRIC